MTLRMESSNSYGSNAANCENAFMMSSGANLPSYGNGIGLSGSGLGAMGTSNLIPTARCPILHYVNPKTTGDYYQQRLPPVGAAAAAAKLAGRPPLPFSNYDSGFGSNLSSGGSGYSSSVGSTYLSSLSQPAPPSIPPPPAPLSSSPSAASFHYHHRLSGPKSRLRIHRSFSDSKYSGGPGGNSMDVYHVSPRSSWGAVSRVSLLLVISWILQ